MSVDRWLPPPPKEMFPRPFVEAADWRAWERHPATAAVLTAFWREMEALKRIPFSADAMANQLLIGKVQGLELALRLIAGEEDAALGPEESDESQHLTLD